MCRKLRNNWFGLPSADARSTTWSINTRQITECVRLRRAQRVEKSKAHNWFWLQLSEDARGSTCVHRCKITFCHEIFFFLKRCLLLMHQNVNMQHCSKHDHLGTFSSQEPHDSWLMLTWTRTQDSQSRTQLCFQDGSPGRTTIQRNIYKKSDYLRNVAVGQRGCCDTSGLCLDQHQGLDQHRLGFCQWRFLTPPPDWEVSGPPLKSDHSLGPAWPKMQR